MVSIWPDGPRSNAIKIKVPGFDSTDTEGLTDAEIQGQRRIELKKSDAHDVSVEHSASGLVWRSAHAIDSCSRVCDALSDPACKNGVKVRRTNQNLLDAESILLKFPSFFAVMCGRQ